MCVILGTTVYKCFNFTYIINVAAIIIIMLSLLSIICLSVRQATISSSLIDLDIRILKCDL